MNFFAFYVITFGFLTCSKIPINRFWARITRRIGSITFRTRNRTDKLSSISRFLIFSLNECKLHKSRNQYHCLFQFKIRKLSYHALIIFISLLYPLFVLNIHGNYSAFNFLRLTKQRNYVFVFSAVNKNLALKWAFVHYSISKRSFKFVATSIPNYYHFHIIWICIIKLKIMQRFLKYMIWVVKIIWEIISNFLLLFSTNPIWLICVFLLYLKFCLCVRT